MMYIYLWSVVTVLLVPRIVHSTDKCALTHGSTLNVSVVGRRNQTGHWIVHTALTSTNLDQHGKGPREVAMNVAHGSNICADSDTVHLVATVAISPPIPADYELFPGLGYYKLHVAALDWEHARQTCVREGAHLMVINSDAETVVVKEFLTRKETITNTNHKNVLLVGIHDRYKEGQWITVLGDSLINVGYANWKSGEPNGGVKENCVIIDEQGVYIDIPCDWKFAFVCEL